MRRGLIRYEQFEQRVRRHRTSDVLEAAAASSVALTNQFHGQPSNLEFSNRVQHWALAGIAKAAIVAGNDHRSTRVTVRDIEEMCDAYINIEEPFTLDPNAPGSLSTLFVRIAVEQFPTQISVFEELARTEALLTDAAAASDQSVITPEFWADALGCSLIDFVGAALLLNIGALCNGGYYDPGWLSQPNFVPVLDQLPRAAVEAAAERHFLASRAMFKHTAEQHRLDDRYLRRLEFNPLIAHPFVEQPDGRFIAPVPRHVLTRATPTGLYYIGFAHGGKAFTTALGTVFEDYVGDQLRLVEPELLLHDVEYRKSQRAADWIIVLPNAVLIVEAKATRMTEAGRLSAEGLAAELERVPARGIRQIEGTAELIAANHPAFADVPSDRPVIGLVVTLEPYHLSNSQLVWARETGKTPVLIASIRELEHLVSITDAGIDDVLLKVMTDHERSRWNLANAIGDHETCRNPILDDAWSRYPFRDDDAGPEPEPLSA